MVDLNAAQHWMKLHAVDGWLIYDFRGSNPVMWEVLGTTRSMTRRAFLHLRTDGIPTLLVQFVDKPQVADLPVQLQCYSSWSDLHQRLKDLLRNAKRIAMDYSPGGELPIISYADGGTLDLVRSIGPEVISSANLFQAAVAAWSEEAVSSHMKASQRVAETKDAAFDLVRHQLAACRTVTEYDVQEFIMKEFERYGLETEDRPIVAVNQNSGNPHYEPNSQTHETIRDGDWLLIDLWARYPGHQNVFSDITWVASVGSVIQSRHQHIFDIVRTARDAVLVRLNDGWKRGEELQGWQLDDVARQHIATAGYGDRFLHRTGHSIGPGRNLHALGVNLDNFETHDTRPITPAVGFSIEPGIYLQDFGVRLEINVFVDPTRGPLVTSPVQSEIVLLR